jgi:hypothetical protein
MSEKTQGEHNGVRFRVLSGNRIQAANILLTTRLQRTPQGSARQQKSRRIQREARPVLAGARTISMI